MNTYFWVIVAILLGSFLLDTILDWLNLSHAKIEPKELKKFYSRDEYKKSLIYLGETTKFGTVKNTIMTPLILLFIFIGGFNSIDIFARNFGLSEILTGLIFAGLLLLINQLISLPFTIYSTFVIENKHGFNKTTPVTFIKDQFKILGLSIVIGATILYVILWVFLNLGNSAWVAAWAGVSMIQIIILFLAPILILPLFNKFTPLPKGKLRRDIKKYLKSQNFKIKGLYTVDSSKRSTKSNAYFTGFGKYKKIALFDTLIKNQTNDEMVSILAHEVGHYKKRHILKRIVISIATTGLTFFIFSLLLNNPHLFQAFKMENLSIHASLVFISLLFTPLGKVLSIFGNSLSRKYEHEADEFAVKTYKKNPFISALKKLTRDNLSNLNPHPLVVFMEYSHPPIIQRIKAIKSHTPSSQ